VTPDRLLRDGIVPQICARNILMLPRIHSIICPAQKQPSLVSDLGKWNTHSRINAQAENTQIFGSDRQNSNE
jgi:hypothetical protein